MTSCQKCGAPAGDRLCRECKVEHSAPDPRRMRTERSGDCARCGAAADGYGEPGELVCSDCAGENLRSFTEVRR